MPNAQDARAHEATPLLTTRAEPRPPPHQHVAHPQRALIAIYTLVVLLEVGDYLQRAPWLRMVESILCQKYYEEHDPSRFGPSPVPEHYCKLDPIQNELNTLVGVDMFLSYIPGLFLTVPYGTLAETRGRKFVLNLSLLGIALGAMWQMSTGFLAHRGYFDIQWFLVSNAFFIVGGGASVLISCLFTTLADLVPQEQRSNAFFRLTAATLTASIVSVPLASYLMKFSLWLPMFLALGLFVGGMSLTLAIPETRPVALTAAAAELPEAEYAHSCEQRHRPWYRPKMLQQVMENYAFMLASPILLVISSTFIVQSLGKNTMRFIMTLASKRFEWTLAQSAFLMPLTSIATLILLLALLPAATFYLSKTREMPFKAVNLTIAQTSIILLVIGLGGIALSTNSVFVMAAVVVYAFGSGYSPAMRSVATTFVPADSVAKAFAVFQTLDTLGSIATSPLLTQAYILGSEWGGVWYGLPFLVAGVLYAIAAVVTFMLRFSAPGDEQEDVETE